MAPRQQGLAGFLKGSSTEKHQSRHEYLSFSSFKRQKRDSGGDASRFGICPLCNTNLPLHVLESHAGSCTGKSEESEGKAMNHEKVNRGGSCSDSHENSRFEACPVCNVRFPMHLLISHADGCTGPSVAEEASTEMAQITTSKSLPVEKEEETTFVQENKQEAQVPWWKLAKIDTAARIDNPIVPSSEPIPGLHLFESFISEEEEEMILSELDGSCPEYRHEFLPWKQAKFNGSNKGKRWGVHCNLRDRRVYAPENPMPHFFDAILSERLKRVQPMAGCIPNEANAIDYRRKQGHWLQSHVDDRQLSKEPIANLSVAGDCYMTFRNERVAGVEERVLLKRRTLQVLTGKARYDYSHGISNDDLLSDRRVSITMRESPLTKHKK